MIWSQIVTQWVEGIVGMLNMTSEVPVRLHGLPPFHKRKK